MGVMGRVSEAHKNLDIDCSTLLEYIIMTIFFMHTVKLCISLAIIITTYMYLDINTL